MCRCQKLRLYSLMIPWWRTLFGDAEIEKLRESVFQEHISQGPVTEQFEAELAAALDVPYTVMTTSGSAALLMTLMALGIGHDDEVIVPNRTWIATAHAVLLVGAKVILVDVRSDIPTIDVSQIRRKITSRTKAIIPVHLNGRAVDMKEIHSIAREHGLYVIEDACQALFSKNSNGFLGTQSDAGCFSLGVTKLISTGQGGFVVIKNRKTYEKLKLIRNHGVSDYFAETWNQLGFNFKFTDLLASFGLQQLRRVPGRIAHLNEIYTKYAAVMAELPFLQLVTINVSKGELPLYIEVICEQRDQLMEFLSSHGIQTRAVPPNLHIAKYISNDGQFPNSIVFGAQGLYLPCGPEQPLDNVNRVVEVLRLFGVRK